jgi:lysylphosphatidylglycerol synthetase-like protein (DUF2156 family)
MFRNVPQHRTLTPGYAVVYPNRERVTSRTTKAIVVLIMLVSVALMLVVTIGGWTKLQGLKPVNLIWCIAYLIMAFYIATRWARGLLPITTGLAVLLLIMVVIAGTGLTGVSWFDRSNPGFGSAALSADFLGLITVLLIPVQILLIFFAMLAFGQSWNVEVEVPIDEAKRRGYTIAESRPGTPATV